MKEINYTWKHSMNPKVHQRAVNRVIRAINENVARDDLWQGRFFVRQWSARPVGYEDGSGMELWIELRFYDHKTRKYMPMWMRSNEIIIWGGSKIWQAMNDFIIEDIDVWRNEKPYNEKIDWTRASKEETIRLSKSLRVW